jgi:mono/diheme cytochrome c family protein
MILRLLSLATLLAGAGAAALPPARAQDGDVQQGHALAQQQCAACHAIGRGSAASPNAKAPAFRTIAAVPGMTALALGVALRTPHREMPNIILEDRQRDDVVAYILSLRAN